MVKNLLFQSKKADAVVTILVLLTLLLVAFSLFKFVTSDWSSQEKILDTYAIQDFYVEQENLVFLLKDISREIVNSNSDDSLETQEFIRTFKERFSQEAKRYVELGIYLPLIENGDYSGTRIEEGKLYFSLKGVESSKVLANQRKGDPMTIKYDAPINFEIGF
ncbi:hypothetical protein FJZ17_03635 [Candidatus Pacearchaeota archaeon]|nr:hypothetical protein [Candidatus Pacearchaeota archaeon]